MPYRAVDLTPVRTYSLASRASRVMVEQFIRPDAPPPPFDHPELGEVAERVVQARRGGAPVIAMIGGHVIKRGLALLLIDLLERGAITHVASNGAAAIHDFEIALQGSTSEDVAASLADGSFGMAEETGAGMNRAIQQGVQQGMGLGESLGSWIAADPKAFPFRAYSLLYHACRLGIPYTVHVAIGTDIIHQHPLVDFAALGWASGQDFKIFTQAVTGLEGGVFLNFGSAVIGPEVFLKALSIARNLGHPTRVITTANFDLVPLGDYRKPIGDDQVDYYYRPRKNIINRPTLLGGRGYHIQGDHLVTLPNLAAQVRAGLEGSELKAISQRLSAPPAPPAAPRAQTDPAPAISIPHTSPAPVCAALPLTRARLIAILDAIAALKTAVIGDFTLDAYWYADMTRSQISRETPLFPRPIVRETYSPGGAANVAWNLAALGTASTRAFTAWGGDWRAALLCETLARCGVSTEDALTLPERSTPLFGKILLTNGALTQEDARLDFVNAAPLSAAAEQELLARITRAAPELDVLIVADYQENGVFSPAVRAALSALAQQKIGRVWVADSRDHLGSYSGMVLKPNEVEAARLLFPDRAPAQVSEADLRQGGLGLHRHTGMPVCITLGERGCLLFDGGTVTHLPAVPVAPPIDPVGAGDTFVACLAACLGAKATPAEAAAVAALAAAVTVRILRITGAATPQAILDVYDHL